MKKEGAKGGEEEEEKGGSGRVIHFVFRRTFDRCLCFCSLLKWAFGRPKAPPPPQFLP